MKPRSILQLRYLIYICLSGGCAISKPYVSPAPLSVIEYHDVPVTDAARLMQWFELYQDTVLSEMIKLTLDSNRNLLTSTARIEEAQAQAAVIRANLYPQAGYQAQGGGGRAGTEARKVSGGYQGAAINGYATLGWELDLWGKLRDARRSARAYYLSMISTRNALQVSLVAEVASQYFLLRDLDNRLLISQQTLESREVYTKMTSEKFDRGYIAEVDKLLAIQQEAEVSATIPGLQLQIVQTENSIRLLMGKGPGTVKRGYSNFEQSLSPEIPVGLSSQLLQRRPDIVSAEESLRSQYERIGVAQASRFPTLSLTGLLGFASPQLSSVISGSGLVANGFASVTGPVFNFNRLKNQVKVEKKRTEQLYYQYQQTVLGAFADVDNSLTYVKRYAEQYEQVKRMVDASSRGLVLSDARYNHGFTSYLEVLTQQDNLFNAQIQQSIALQGKLNAIVMLYKSLGGGW